MTDCLPVYLPAFLSVYLTVCVHTYLPAYLPTCLQVCLFTCNSICLPSSLSACLSASCLLPVFLPVCILSSSLSACLSASCLLACLLACLLDCQLVPCLLAIPSLTVISLFPLADALSVLVQLLGGEVIEHGGDGGDVPAPGHLLLSLGPGWNHTRKDPSCTRKLIRRETNKMLTSSC